MSDFKAKTHKVFDLRWGPAPDPIGEVYSAPPDPVAIFKGPTSKGRERDRGREEGGEGEGTEREGQEKRKGRNGRGQASQIFRPRIAPVHKARKHARRVTDSLTHSFASLLGRIACNAQMRLVATDVARALSRCVYCLIGEHR